MSIKRKKSTGQLKSANVSQQIIMEYLMDRSVRYKACQFDGSIEEINVRICICNNWNYP